MTDDTQPAGVHLVGSVPFDDCEQVFQQVSACLGSHICRLPDGETGERSNWVDWQLPKLIENPNLQLIRNESYKYTQVRMVCLGEGADRNNLQLGDLGYANAAIASYTKFAELKNSGNIQQHCRFQVCLPTPLATTTLYVEPSLQADFEPQYEARLLEELSKILDAIPHTELAIQWDTAVEFALLEGVMPCPLQNLEKEIVERLIRLTDAVPEPVELGFHLCYGDSQHKHFCEPQDMSKLVSMASDISNNIKRSLQWIHMPVPRGRHDDAYFKPLENLALGKDTQLFLGLVHFTDKEEGAARRIKVAKKFINHFGVATECGFGRRPTGSLDELMQIHAQVSSPIST